MRNLSIFDNDIEQIPSALRYTIDLVANNQGLSSLEVIQKIRQYRFSIANYSSNYNFPVGDDSFTRDMPQPFADIFYLINCQQEAALQDYQLDKYGRFKFSQSWQSKFEVITENLAQSIIDEFIKSIGLYPKRLKTKLFVSHDIDFLYGSRKEDLKWAATNWQLRDILKIIFQEFIRRPHWRNIDRVLALDNSFDVRSTFFWLVNEGVGEYGIPNADYSVTAEKELIEQVSQSGCYNGLHKSASLDSLETEIYKSGRPWKCNRNHYLRFRTHDHWRSISESGIKLDCSLGFAEHFGFRNSYGKPFTPFDIENDRPYNFVEAPLHVMDATFLHYLKTEPDKIGSTVIDFIEKNKQDCVLSILWHNNYLTNFAYKPYLKAYKEILGYIYENQLKTISPDQIIDKYLL